MNLKAAILEMIRLSTSDLPKDVEDALKTAVDKEEKGSSAQNALNTLLENITMAREKSTPMCQDTGALIFYVDFPESSPEKLYREAITDAVKEGTAKQYLRPNAVDPITGKNSGDNIGINTPYIHFNQWDKNYVRIRFMQKGGGCENCGTQYRLPDMDLNAGRDLKGIRKCVIDAINNSQGQGCAPGIVGVGIGGDRALSHILAKEQLFRTLGNRNENPQIASMEISLKEELNTLGIGPMGFGGKTTVLDVLIGYQHRHPATFYVSIAYMCWADRHKTLTIKGEDVTYA